MLLTWFMTMPVDTTAQAHRERSSTRNLVAAFLSRAHVSPGAMAEPPSAEEEAAAFLLEYVCCRACGRFSLVLSSTNQRWSAGLWQAHPPPPLLVMRWCFCPCREGRHFRRRAVVRRLHRHGHTSFDDLFPSPDEVLPPQPTAPLLPISITYRVGGGGSDAASGWDLAAPDMGQDPAEQ